MCIASKRTGERWSERDGQSTVTVTHTVALFPSRIHNFATVFYSTFAFVCVWSTKYQNRQQSETLDRWLHTVVSLAPSEKRFGSSIRSCARSCCEVDDVMWWWCMCACASDMHSFQISNIRSHTAVSLRRFYQVPYSTIHIWIVARTLFE